MSISTIPFIILRRIGLKFSATLQDLSDSGIKTTLVYFRTFIYETEQVGGGIGIPSRSTFMKIECIPSSPGDL